MTTLVASAYPAFSATLEEAVSKSITMHPQIESARAAIDITKQDIVEQKSAYFPELSVNATGGRVYGDNATSRGLSVTRGAGYSYLWEGSLSARQMIYDGNEAENRIKSAIAQKQSSDISLQDIREALSYSVVQTYINLARARLGYNLIVEHEKSVGSYLERIRTMVNDGAADEAELQQARDVRIILDNFRADYKGQILAAESDYLELTGEAAPQEIVKPQSLAATLPEHMEAALAGIDSHPSIRAVALQSQASRYEVGAEEAALYPDVDGELSYLKKDQRDIIGGEATDARAVIKMNWAFETGGAQLARIKKRSLEYQDAMARQKDLKGQIERGVRLAYAEYETAHRQNENQDKRLDLNKKLMETYKSQFEGARVSLLQLMQADNQLFNTKLEKINATHRLLLAEYGILASLGRLQNSLGLTVVADNQPQRNAQMDEQGPNDQSQ